MTRKLQVTPRAGFELLRRGGQGPVKISQVARARALPSPFLEVILSQRKQGGFVRSQRGSAGGYVLARSPKELMVGELTRFIFVSQVS